MSSPAVPRAPESTTPERQTVSPENGRLNLRGVLIALLCQVGLLFWVVRSEITARVFVSSWTLSMPGIILLLAMLWINAQRRGRAFTRTEMLVAYVAISGSATMVGYNFFQLLIPTLGTGVYYATTANRWGRVLEHVPTWLYPQDEAALRALFHGESPVTWGPWIVPLAAWASLVLAVILGSLALNVLIADIWIRKERLAFPIATIPLEMTQPGTPLFRNRLLWLGFLIPVALNSLLALNYYYPSVPAVVLKHQDYSQGMVDPPLSTLRPIAIGFTPFIVGLAFMAPLDVSFSIWFFQWFIKFQRIVAYAAGWVDATDLGSRGEPHLDDQTVGAFLAMALIVLWRAWPRREPVRERGVARDPALHRTAVVVLGVCLLYALGFLWLAGFSFPVAAALLALYGLTVLVISRVRAEAGFAWTYGPDRGTASLSHIVVNTAGPMNLAPRDLALIGFFHWFWWDLRFAMMPAQMEALKIGDAGAIRRRQVVALLVLASVVAIVVGLFAVMQDSYRFGWSTGKVYVGPQGGARVGYTLAANWMQNRTPPRWDKTYWTLGGAMVTFALAFFRQRFPWWPFHPVGYAMAATATSFAFWSHYFIAWLVKLLILRYGGMRLYRAALPFVFGVILGDIASQTLWSIGASLLDIPVYQFVS